MANHQYPANCTPTAVDTGNAPANFYNSKSLACGFNYPDQLPSANFSACCSGPAHFYKGCFHWCTTDETPVGFNQCLGQQFDFSDGLGYGSLCNSGVGELRVGWWVWGLMSLFLAVVVMG